MSAAANTKDCFRALVGERIVGVMFDALPLGNKGAANGAKTLVLEDGRGLTITGTGTYWLDSAEDVARAVERARRDLVHAHRELAALVDLAGLVESRP